MIRRFVGRKQVVAANKELELASIHLQHLRLRLKQEVFTFSSSFLFLYGMSSAASKAKYFYHSNICITIDVGIAKYCQQSSICITIHVGMDWKYQAEGSEPVKRSFKSSKLPLAWGVSLQKSILMQAILTGTLKVHFFMTYQGSTHLLFRLASNLFSVTPLTWLQNCNIHFQFHPNPKHWENYRDKKDVCGLVSLRASLCVELLDLSTCFIHLIGFAQVFIQINCICICGLYLYLYFALVSSTWLVSLRFSYK